MIWFIWNRCVSVNLWDPWLLGTQKRNCSAFFWNSYFYGWNSKMFIIGNKDFWTKYTYFYIGWEQFSGIHNLRCWQCRVQWEKPPNNICHVQLQLSGSSPWPSSLTRTSWGYYILYFILILLFTFYISIKCNNKTLTTSSDTNHENKY